MNDVILLPLDCCENLKAIADFEESLMHGNSKKIILFALFAVNRT